MTVHNRIDLLHQSENHDIIRDLAWDVCKAYIVCMKNLHLICCILFAGTSARTISTVTVACGFRPFKIHCSDYQKCFINRINEVFVISIKQKSYIHVLHLYGILWNVVTCFLKRQRAVIKVDLDVYPRSDSTDLTEAVPISHISLILGNDCAKYEHPRSKQIREKPTGVRTEEHSGRITYMSIFFIINCGYQINSM